MKINSVQNYNNNSVKKGLKPAFCSAKSNFLNPLRSEVSLLNQTYLFRGDFDWEEFVKIIDKKFKQAKVHIFGCSDGSEAYSLRIILNKRLGVEKSNKFKIIASDINKENINMGRKGLIHLSDCDEDKLLIYGGQDASYHFSRCTSSKHPKVVVMESSFYSSDAYLHKVDEGLRNSIKFKVQNVLEEAKKNFYEPTIVFFRNAWYQISEKSQKELIQDLSKNMPKGSLLGVGGVETSGSVYCINIQQALKEVNFKPVEGFTNRGENYLFEKV